MLNSSLSFDAEQRSRYAVGTFSNRDRASDPYIIAEAHGRGEPYLGSGSDYMPHGRAL